MPITRTFTVAELEALGVPPSSPNEQDWTDRILAVETLGRLKYSLRRRVIFQDDDGTDWAVEYEDATGSEIDGCPENNGWRGGTVEAVAVEEQQATVAKWVPVEAEATP